MKDCVFCKIINKEVPALILDENESVIVFLSLENHPLIVPKKHIKDIYELDEISGNAVIREAVKIANAAKKSLRCDGINLISSNEQVAGQDIFHFHLHIKPRWKSDSVTLSWSTETVSKEEREKTANKIKTEIGFR